MTRKLTEAQKELVSEVLATFDRRPFAIVDGEVCPIGLPGVEVVGARKDVIRRMVESGAFVPRGEHYVLADWALQHQPFVAVR